MRSTFHCPRWPGCCPDGAVRHDCPALPDRRDTGNWLDRSCEYAVAYPWRIAVVILACIAIVSCVDRPDTMPRSEALAISAVVAGDQP